MGFSIPTSIAGIDIPQIDDVGDLTQLAAQGMELAAAGIAGLDGLPAQAEVIKEVIVASANKVSGGCGVLSASATAVTAIQATLGPVMPLLCAKDNPMEAWKMMTKPNLDIVMKVITDICGMSDLLKAIADILGNVKDGFAALAAAADPIVEAVKAFLADIVDEFAAALNLDASLDGIVGFFESLTSLVGELTNIGGVLGPIAEEWGDNDWASVAGMVKDRWEDMVDAFTSLMPAWETCQYLYNNGKDFAISALASAAVVCTSFAALATGIFEQINMPLPPGFEILNSILSNVPKPPVVDVQKKPEVSAAQAAAGEAAVTAMGMIPKLIKMICDMLKPPANPKETE